MCNREGVCVWACELGVALLGARQKECVCVCVSVAVLRVQDELLMVGQCVCVYVFVVWLTNIISGWQVLILIAGVAFFPVQQ